MEVIAQKHDLNYVKLSGTIGCMVNGAGLAMATMDLINFMGSSPANFLDIGGGSDLKAIKQAMEIINNDQQVKAILINVFGGIVQCDKVAKGVSETIIELKIEKPVVMRLLGN